MFERKYKNRWEANKAKKAREQAYKKRAYMQLSLRFHKTLEADVIEKIASAENKHEYFVNLIRADMAKEKGE